MQQEELRRGLIVIARGAVATVVQCCPNLQVEVLIQSRNERVVLGIEELEFLPARTDDNLSLINDTLFTRAEGASLEEIELARKRFEVMSKYRAGEIKRTSAMTELSISNGLFYKLAEMYEEDAGYLCLLRMKRGRSKGVTLLDEEVEGYIDKAIAEKYNGRAATYAAVWRAVELSCLENGKPIPSQNAVTARIKFLDARELHRRKHGSESAAQKHAPRPGKLITERPLEFAQMDHTRVDVIVVDAKFRRPLGRPWLTIIVDIHTRVILGYYLSLHAPSTLSVACAMTHAALPKHQFLQRINLPATVHPYYGKPKIIHMDNAKEFKTTKFQRACARNGIEPQWRPIGQKHYGGHVERLIGTLMTDHVHFLPGATYSNVIKRRGYDSERRAALTFKEFCRWFAGEVAIYHGRKHSQLGCSPKRAWENYFNTSSEVLRHPPLIAKPWDFRLDFMPERSRTVHNSGVTLNGRWYWSAALIPYVGRGDVVIKFDPFSLGTIWARLDEEYVPLYFADMTVGDYSYEEYRASLIAGQNSKAVKAGGLEDHALTEVIRGNEELVKNSVKATKSSRRKAAALQEYSDSQLTDGPAKQEPLPRFEQVERPDYSKRAKPFVRSK